LISELLIASRNRAKIREICQILSPLKIRIRSLLDLPKIPPVVEDGKTFEENAIKKALNIALKVGLYTLSDDSGIEVEILGGRPGIHSSTYAGRDATDHKNNSKLLSELRGIPWRYRRAQYQAVIALASQEGLMYVTKGICKGYITLRPRGKNGFGYDPIFYLPRFRKTMAQLPARVKNRISHRAQALKQLKALIAPRPLD
jgi:XTP/dITP diphosphohydrolase